LYRGQNKTFDAGCTPRNATVPLLFLSLAAKHRLRLSKKTSLLVYRIGMGINSELRKEVFSYPDYKDAFVQEKGAIVISKYARVVDFLTLMHSMRTVDPDTKELVDKFTPAHFANRVRYLIEHNNAAVYVLCVDYQPWVPTAKHVEQKRRHESKRKGDDLPKYPTDATFVDQGIVVPSESPDPQPFSMKRLLKSRHVRTRLWDYVREKFEGMAPFSKAVIFDCNRQIYRFAIGPTGLEPRVVPDTKDLTHRYGESDKKMIFWTRMFHDIPVVLESVDGDTMPLALQYIHMSKPKREYPVYWYIPNRSRNAKIVNLTLLHDRMQAGTLWTIPGFLLGCIMCGTDFCEKRSLFNFIGTKFILSALGHCSHHLHVILEFVTHYSVKRLDETVWTDEQHEAYTDIHEALDAFTFVVRRVYNEFCISKMQTKSLLKEPAGPGQGVSSCCDRCLQCRQGCKLYCI
jgi:hypothetical protein